MDLALGIQVLTTLFSGAVTVVAAWLGWKLQKNDTVQKEKDQEKERRDTVVQAQQEATAKGLQCLLRDRIIQLHDKCKEKDGKKTYYEAQNMLHMYEAYHNLGGNGIVTGIFEEFEGFELVPVK